MASAGAGAVDWLAVDGHAMRHHDATVDITEAERLAQIAPEVPVLVASGSTTDPVMANPPEHGFTAALHKPFSIEEVDKVTNALLVRANSI